MALVNVWGKEIKRAKKIEQKQIEFANNFAKEKAIKNGKLDEAKVRILSHCMFDGSVYCSHNNFSISYTNSSLDCIRQFERDMNFVFGLVPTSFHSEDGKNCRWYQMIFYSKKAYQDLMGYQNTYSTSDKGCRIGDWLFRLPLSMKTEFLRAFWEDEGCISKNGAISGKSKSETVITQLVRLHREFGIDCSIWKDNISKNFAIYVKKNKNNIRKFNKIGFGDGLVTSGFFIGEKKANIFKMLYGQHISTI